jgi:rhodanese-related sulfurtransferase
MSPTIARKRDGLATVVTIALALTACGGGDPAEPVAEAAPADVAGSADGDVPFGLVSPQTAAGLAADTDITVIDVRTPEEYGGGHLDGATMVDFYADTFADEIAGLDRDGTYLIYCRSGNRSGQTSALMEQLGFEQVYDLDGGVIAWSGAGLTLGGS